MNLMKAFTVLTKTVHAAKTDLRRLDSLIKWSWMKFKAKESRSGTISNKKQKEARFTIEGKNISTVK